MKPKTLALVLCFTMVSLPLYASDFSGLLEFMAGLGIIGLAAVLSLIHCFTKSETFDAITRIVTLIAIISAVLIIINTDDALFVLYPLAFSVLMVVAKYLNNRSYKRTG